jgi:hypothetical protein
MEGRFLPRACPKVAASSDAASHVALSLTGDAGASHLERYRRRWYPRSAVTWPLTCLQLSGLSPPTICPTHDHECLVRATSIVDGMAPSELGRSPFVHTTIVGTLLRTAKASA